MGACHSTKTPNPREGNHHYRTQHLAKKLAKQQQQQQQQQQQHKTANSDPPPHTMSPTKSSITNKDDIHTSRPTKHIRASSAPIRPPSDSVFITNIQSHIGRATVRALTSTNPLIKIRGGVSTIPSSPYVDGHRVDMVRCDIRKRQSMIWDLIGVETLLITPCANDTQYLAALFIVAAAKVAGVKFVAVVSMPDINGNPKTGAASPTSLGTTNSTSTSTGTTAPIPQQPNVIEQAVLKAKLDCCFIRLPFFIDDEHLTTEQLLRQEPHPHKLSFSALTDIGTACASILTEWSEHVNAQYDMAPSAYIDAYVNKSTATTACVSTAHSTEHSQINDGSTHHSTLQLAGLTTSVPPNPKSRSPSMTPRESISRSTSITSSPSYSPSEAPKAHALPVIRLNDAYTSQSHTHPHPPRHAHTARRMETAH